MLRRLAGAVAGCSTILEGGGGLAPEATYAASPANIASLTEVIRDTPNDPQAHNMRGTVLAQAGRRQEALVDFNKAIALDPKYAQAYANRGLLHRQNNQLDLALRDYDTALSIDPSYAAAHLGRGLTWRQKGDARKALDDYQPRHRDAARHSAQGYYNRAMLYQSQRQHQFAIEDFAIAIQLSPREAEPYLGRGPELSRRRRPEIGGGRSRQCGDAGGTERRRLDQPRACL